MPMRASSASRTDSRIPTRTPKKNKRMRNEGTGLLRSGGPPRREVLRAVDGPIRTRQEWDLRSLPAVAAGDVVHVRRARRATLFLRALAAVGAALWLVDETLLLVELLLASAPHECVPALAAGQRLVGKRHP